MQETTITGWHIARPDEYWAAMRENYPSKRERDRAAATGFDHFGRYGMLGDYLCYRCGFLCEGEDDVETVAWSSSNPTGEIGRV